ncbi:MAG: hypothetical protein IPK20_18470 [Betaproteobacteria bacterium]|nr:hypothetical protein [Betaproteobacteria bacterium]
MITLGINAAFHDSAAVLVVDGRVIAAAEEERSSRIKHAKRPVPFSAWELPYAAIDYCLEAGGTALAGVDHIAYSFDPDALTGSEPASGGIAGEHARRDDEVPAGGLQALFESNIRRAPLQLVDGVPHHLRARFAKESLHWQWHFVSHHLSHQASAFLAAPFDECAVMTLDGRGERAPPPDTAYGRTASTARSAKSTFRRRSVCSTSASPPISAFSTRATSTR